MISSSFHRSFSLRRYPGKLKNSGCAVLNLLSIANYRNVVSALLTPLHIWDIAAAHAVLKSFGLDMEDLNGNSIKYKNLINGESTPGLLLAGSLISIKTTKRFLDPVI